MSNQPENAWTIKHHSPSSLNLYRNNISQWIMRYGYRFRQETGAAQTLGLSMEKALATWAGYEDMADEAKPLLQNKSIEELGYFYFEQKAQGQLDEKWGKYREAIPIVAERLELLHRDFFIDVGTYQERINVPLPGCDFDLIGDIDFMGKVHDSVVVLDLKLKDKMPSEAVQDHVRQVSAYAKATNATRAAICYVSTAKKPSSPITVFWLTQAQIEQGFNELCQTARAVETMMKIAATPDELTKIVAPNFDDWRVSKEEKEKMLEVWGLQNV